MANELWIEPTPMHFKHGQEELLKQTLDLDRHLILSPLSKPQDVALDETAHVELAFGSGIRKYKLTNWALSQLCQLTCPSLYGFVTDLAGVHRSADTDRSDYSFTEAIDILNRTVRRRFATHLQGRVALVDTSRGIISGFVSATYRWLPNYELYERVSEAMKQLPNVAFLEADLIGRWLLLRYVETKPCASFTTDGGMPDLFFSGFHFSNNEVGKASVKAANMLYRKFSRSSSISTVTNKDGNVRHAGLRFEFRFQELINGLMNRQSQANSHAVLLRALQLKSLRLGNKNPAAEEKRIDELASKLIRRGMPGQIAKSVVTNTLHQGSYEEVPVELSLYRPKDRTIFDLYNAMGRCAVSLPINHRERTEQMAFAVLMGRVVFD